MDGSLTGKLLIAMPGIGDPRFEKSVIVMCMHTPEAAMGLVINKVKEDLTLGDVLEHLGVEAPEPIAARAVLEGGPVKPDRGYVLHSNDFDAGDATQFVTQDLSLTATRDVLEALGEDRRPPQSYVLALGYAGWGAGQLENELHGNVWLIADLERSIVFDEAHDKKWTRAIRSLGIDPSMLTGDSGRA
ncbi:MAG: YqgE/AlgH family protein [Hyphomonadaceae bacterium]|nr:YqgE/AlgH family protein [Hyphomonadaceae bacterium]